jgi:FkbM family methyltransferase
MFKKSVKYLLSLMNLNVTRVDKFSKQHEQSQQLGKFMWLKNYQVQTVIDIGANEGQFITKTLPVFPNATIHCFEPLQDVYGKLKKNFEKTPNVITHNFGLGEANEEKEIFNNEYSPSSSMLEMMSFHKENFDFAVKVEPKRIAIRRLDDFFPADIAKPLLVKIDVQGYEMFVLKGGDKVVRQADIVIIETSFYPLYKGQPLFEEIYDYFVARGFQYAGNIEELSSPVDNRILQADAIFINKAFFAKHQDIRV